MPHAQGWKSNEWTNPTAYLDEGVGYEQINPGNALDTTVVFDVPVGTVPAEIELHDSAFSGGTTVALR